MDVPLHSAIKHHIISYYFGILKNFCRGTPPYTFNYIDLYSGDAECTLRDEIPEKVMKLLPDDIKIKWEPPFLTLLDFASQYGKLRFFFNDNEEESITKLKRKLNSYSEKIKVVTENKDAENCVNDALSFIKRPNIPSLFYLDPFNHKTLKFSMIDKISKFKDDTTKRMPELIINLMVYSMLKAIERKDYQNIDETMGSHDWFNELKKYQAKEITHELFRDFFIKQLNKRGYHCTSYLVRSIRHKAPQYYLIFATYSEQIYLVHKKMEPNIKKLQEEKWVRASHKITYLTDHVKNNQKLLWEF